MSSINLINLILMLLMSEVKPYSGHSSDFFQQVDKHEFIYPRIISRREVRFRYKRSDVENEENDNETVYITFNDWIIKTSVNKNLIIPSHYKVQWASSGGHEKNSYHHNEFNIDRCFPLDGEILGVENSQVLITVCNYYYYGLVIVDNKYYFIQPSSSNGSHAFYETKLPGSMITLMDQFSVHFREEKSTVKHESLPDEEIYLNNDIKFHGLNLQTKKPKCNAWEVNKTGEKKYIALNPELCPGNNNNNNNHNNNEKMNSRRLRRHSVHSNYQSNQQNNSQSRRPYRVFKTCESNRRRKRVLTICDSNEQFDMTGDVTLPVDYSNDFRNANDDNRRDLNADDTDYFNEEDETLRMHRDSKQNFGVKRKWIKIMIGVDFDVIEFHGKLTEQYIFTMFNIVSTLFKKISSLNIVNIVIMKIIMYPDPRDSAIRGEDERYPLYGANKWSRQIKEKFAMAMWYTHYPLGVHVKTCYNSKMCDPQWSCIIIRDEGWISSIKIAHGIGHLIGLTHDGDLDSNNTCASEAILEGTIMSKNLPDVIPVPTWSKCSNREFHAYIENYRCLARPPASHDVQGYLTGIFTLDEQCRIEFGDSYVYCLAITITDPCRELWCSRVASRKRICTTRKSPTLEGTPCGRGKKCINTVCTDAYRNKTEITSTTTKKPVAIPPFADWIATASSSTTSPLIGSATESISFLPAQAASSSPLSVAPDWPPIKPTQIATWIPTAPGTADWEPPNSGSNGQPAYNWTANGQSGQYPSNWTSNGQPGPYPTNGYPTNWTLTGQSSTNGQQSGPINGQPIGQQNGPQNGQQNGPINGQPTGQQNGLINGQPTGQQNGLINGQPTGQQNGLINGQPTGQQNGPINGQPTGQQNGLINGQPTGQQNGLINGQPTGQQNGLINGQPTGQQNGLINGQPTGQQNGLINGQPTGQQNGPQNGQIDWPTNGQPGQQLSTNWNIPGQQQRPPSEWPLPSSNWSSNGQSNNWTLNGQQPARPPPNGQQPPRPPAANGQQPGQPGWNQPGPYGPSPPGRPPTPPLANGLQNNWPSSQSGAWNPNGPYGSPSNSMSNPPAQPHQPWPSSRSLTPLSVRHSTVPQSSSRDAAAANQSIFSLSTYLRGQLTSSNQQSRSLALNLSDNRFYSPPNQSLHYNLTTELMTYPSLNNLYPRNYSRNNTSNSLLLNNSLDALKLRLAPSGPFFN